MQDRGYIYVIGAMEHFDKVKVGLSTSAPQNGRLAALQGGNPYSLTVWGYFKVTRGSVNECERLIHKELSAAHFRGEWFKMHPKDALKSVEQMVAEYNTIKESKIRHKAFCAVGNQVNLAKKLAQMSGRVFG